MADNKILECNWIDFQSRVIKLKSMKVIEDLIKEEKKTYNRKSFIFRLRQRWNALNGKKIQEQMRKERGIK